MTLYHTSFVIDPPQPGAGIPVDPVAEYKSTPVLTSVGFTGKLMALLHSSFVIAMAVVCDPAAGVLLKCPSVKANTLK